MCTSVYIANKVNSFSEECVVFLEGYLKHTTKLDFQLNVRVTVMCNGNTKLY